MPVACIPMSWRKQPSENLVRPPRARTLPSAQIPACPITPEKIDLPVVDLAMKEYQPRTSRLSFLAFGMAALAAAALIAPRAVRAAESRTGEQIYKEQCAS